MQYMGGKSRIARQIAEFINEIPRRKVTDCQTPCPDNHACGGGGRTALSAYFAAVVPLRARCRAFPARYSMTATNTSLPCSRASKTDMSCRSVSPPEEYRYIRDHKDDDPALAGFVGFGCSFGGKWFGGYARNASGTNYALQSKRSLLKDMATLQDACFVCEDYRRVCIPPGAVIYADPPYNNTTGYSGERFDSAEFWRAMRLLADTGHTVFVSEQEAPPGIECIWEKPFTRTLDRNKGNQFTVTEKLFYLPARRHGPCTC